MSAHLVAPVNAIGCGQAAVEGLPGRGCAVERVLGKLRSLVGKRGGRGRHASSLTLQSLAGRHVYSLRWCPACSCGRLWLAWGKPGRGALSLRLCLWERRRKVGRRALCAAVHGIVSDSIRHQIPCMCLLSCGLLKICCPPVDMFKRCLFSVCRDSFLALN